MDVRRGIRLLEQAVGGPMQFSTVNHRREVAFGWPEPRILAARVTLIFVALVGVFIVWFAIYTMSAVGVFLLVLLVLNLWFNIRPLSTATVRLVVSDDGIRTYSLLARKSSIPWGALVAAQLVPDSVWRAGREIKLLNREGRPEVIAGSRLDGFDRFVEIVRERVKVVEEPRRRSTGPGSLASPIPAGSPNLPLRRSPSPSEPESGVPRLNVTAHAPVAEVRATLSELLTAEGFKLSVVGSRLDASSGWVELSAALMPENTGTGVHVTAREGSAPRLVGAVSLAFTLVAFVSWALWLKTIELIPILGVILGAQLVELVLLRRVAAKRVGAVTLRIQEMLVRFA